MIVFSNQANETTAFNNHEKKLLPSSSIGVVMVARHVRVQCVLGAHKLSAQLAVVAAGRKVDGLNVISGRRPILTILSTLATSITTTLRFLDITLQIQALIGHSTRAHTWNKIRHMTNNRATQLQADQ